MAPKDPSTHGPLRVAIMGTRGIPANYGGFETFAEELSKRLIAAGAEVTVYCRRPFFKRIETPATFNGVRLRYAPTIMHKYLETPLHAFFSFLDLIFHRVDVVLLCNAANAPFAWIVRLLGIPLVINVDGIERKRAKWSALGKLWYRLGEICAVLFASRIVADAESIRVYYREKYTVETTVIGYGAVAVPLPAGPVLEKLAVEAGKYILYVSRLEPENNALGVIHAYQQARTELPLVIVGDAPYAAEYKQALLQAAAAIENTPIGKKRVVFAGFQFGAAYRELRSHCAIYIQATEVGGTHPALVEAMAYGNPTIANDVPEHREVLADGGLYYPYNDFTALGGILDQLLLSTGLRHELIERARARVATHYTWDGVTAQYLKLFKLLYDADASRPHA